MEQHYTRGASTYDYVDIIIHVGGTTGTIWNPYGTSYGTNYYERDVLRAQAARSLMVPRLKAFWASTREHAIAPLRRPPAPRPRVLPGGPPRSSPGAPSAP